MIAMPETVVRQYQGGEILACPTITRYGHRPTHRGEDRSWRYEEEHGTTMRWRCYECGQKSFATFIDQWTATRWLREHYRRYHPGLPG